MLQKKYERCHGVWVWKDPIAYNLWKDTKGVCVASTVHTGNSRYKVKGRMKDQNGRCKDVLVAMHS